MRFSGLYSKLGWFSRFLLYLWMAVFCWYELWLLRTRCVLLCACCGTDYSLFLRSWSGRLLLLVAFLPEYASVVASHGIQWQIGDIMGIMYVVTYTRL